MSDAFPPVHVATRTSDGRPFAAGAATGAWASVHSTYRSTINIATADGLLTIASPAIGGLPNGIVADLGPDFRSLGVRPGQAVDVDALSLRIPAIGLRLDTPRAAVWSPRIRPPDDGVDLAAARWHRRSVAARDVARGLARTGGLADMLGAGSGPAPDRAVLLDVTERARQGLRTLARGLADGDRRAATNAARRLIGLGPGLTPSADDALVGIEAALHAFGRPTAGFLDGTLDDLEERTTTVASTFLRHAARGEFAERLHVLLAALLGPEDAAIPGAIERAVAWGATSGTDCLVGVLSGLDVAARPARQVA